MFFPCCCLSYADTFCFAATLGATSKILDSIDATTRLLDDDPMGRRREPRHPLGLGERDDRERRKKQRKKAREKRRRLRSRLSSKTGAEPGAGDGGSGAGDDGSGAGGGAGEADDLGETVVFEEGDDSDSDEEDTSVDTRAEAGGMGLLLVPLTPIGKNKKKNRRPEYHSRLALLF